MSNHERYNPPQGELPPLWEHQRDFCVAVNESRTAGDTRGMAVMAMGMGKTRAAAEVIREEVSARPGSKVLWLTHREDVKHQSYEVLQTYLDGHDLSFHEVRSWHDPDEVADHDIVFGLFQTMKDYRNYFARDHFDLVVVDESHHTGAATFSPTLDYFTPSYTLGITGIASERELRDVYGPPIIRRDIVDGIEGNFLVAPDYWVISASSVLGKEVRGFNVNNLSPIERERYEELVVRFIEKKIAEAGITDPRVLIFNNSISSADHVASLRDDMEPYHSKIKGRKKVLEDFREGRVKWVSSVNAANEGLDIPAINVIAINNGGPSDVDFQQQIGRGLRKSDNKDKLLVLDFTNNSERLERIEDLMKSLAQKRRKGGKEEVSEELRGQQGEEARRARGKRKDREQETLPDQPIEDKKEEVEESLDQLAEELNMAGLGEFHFDSSSKSAVELLLDVRHRSDVLSGWERQDSIDYYRWLSQRLGRAAISTDIGHFSDINGMPSLRLLTHEFSGSLIELRANATGETLELQRKEFLANWTREDSIRYYQALYTTLGRLPSKTDIEEAADAIGMPSIWALMKDFDGKIDLLRRVCGFEFPTMDGLVSENAIAKEKRVSGNTVSEVAARLGFQAVQAMGLRRLGRAYSLEQAELLRQNIESVASAPEDGIPAVEFAKSRNMKPTELTYVLRKLKITPDKKRVGREIRYLSSEMQREIDTHLESLSVRPEGSYTVVEAVEILGKNRSQIVRDLAEIDVILQKYWKSTRGGYEVSCIISEDFDYLRRKYGK